MGAKDPLQEGHVEDGECRSQGQADRTNQNEGWPATGSKRRVTPRMRSQRLENLSERQQAKHQTLPDVIVVLPVIPTRAQGNEPRKRADPHDVSCDPTVQITFPCSGKAVGAWCLAPAVLRSKQGRSPRL